MVCESECNLNITYRAESSPDRSAGEIRTETGLRAFKSSAFSMDRNTEMLTLLLFRQFLCLTK